MRPGPSGALAEATNLLGEGKSFREARTRLVDTANQPVAEEPGLEGDCTQRAGACCKESKGEFYSQE